MSKPNVTVPELMTLFLGAAVASGMGWQLAGHHISAFSIAAIVLCSWPTPAFSGPA
jgi:hypothetical protein